MQQQKMKRRAEGMQINAVYLSPKQ